MAYYLLTVQLPGSRAYKEVADAKHHIEASSLDEARLDADVLIDNHYARIDKATMRLFDGSGLVATRQGEGEWIPEA
ncbi:MAG TPA: hypothetical protein VEW71_06990 [Allosphingosinicella sp.]|nr:hypothetical protein [Allosphingosinicella sp.]